VGGREGEDWYGQRFRIHGLLLTNGAARRSWIFRFLATIEAGRRAPNPAGEDTQIEVSEEEVRERGEKAAAQKQQAEISRQERDKARRRGA